MFGREVKGACENDSPTKWIDEAIIQFYYPDTVVQYHMYDSLLFDLSNLEITNFKKYNLLIRNDRYYECKKLIAIILSESNNQGFIHLLEFRMYIHSINYCIQKCKMRVTPSEKKVYSLAQKILFKAQEEGVEKD